MSVILIYSPTEVRLNFEDEIFFYKGRAPRYIELYQIVQRVEVVACRLALPLKLLNVHDVFHVSMLRSCQPDLNTVIQWYDVPIQEDTYYEDALVQILDRKMKSLHRHEIPLAKALWENHGVGEATWELEFNMRERYPHLFTDGGTFKFRGRNFLLGG